MAKKVTIGEAVAKMVEGAVKMAAGFLVAVMALSFFTMLLAGSIASEFDASLFNWSYRQAFVATLSVSFVLNFLKLFFRPARPSL